MKPRPRKLPDLGLFMYLPDPNNPGENKATRVASFWIQQEKGGTCAKGKAEATFTINRGQWLNLFGILKGYVIEVKPPNRY